jgi:site-specific recombinase XerD
MNLARRAPTPIFDNLNQLGNPYKARSYNTDAFFPGKMAPIEGSTIDYEFAWKFIFSYNGSSATVNAYRRELERLLQWAWLIRKQSICLLKREDIEEYLKFCNKPPKAWTGNKNVARFKTKDGLREPNPDWRPFIISAAKSTAKTDISKSNFSLSKAAIQAIFAILSSFYNFLVQEEVADSNPVLSIRQKSKFVQKQQHKAPVRRISNLQWEYIIDLVEQLATDNPQKHERTLFIMYCLFTMYLRISELVSDERANPVMGDFRKDIDENWWFHVLGKGNKSRIVTVSNDMLSALKRYRKHLGLTALPAPDDKTPLVPKNLGNGPVTSTRQIRSIVQQCFDLAYQQMKSDGLEDDAAELKSATVHWLRHTGISEDVKFRPREHVRDDAGHASMQTTDRYIESDLRERHASGKKKRAKDF